MANKQEHLPDPTFVSCALCGSSATLQVSHIIPAFAFRWIKRTGGPIRNIDNPNRRVQDGLKIRMLCRSCEERLQKPEKAFAEKFFEPVMGGQIEPIRNQRWLLYFCVSLSWRLLKYVHDRNPALPTLTVSQRDFVRKALDRWQDFLLGNAENPGIYEQNVVVNIPIADATGTSIPNNINRYMMRGIHFTLAASANSLQTFVKIGPIAVFGMVQPNSSVKFLERRIGVNGGLFDVRRAVPPTWAIQFYSDEATKHGNISERLSTVQREKVENYIQQNIDWFAKSDQFRALQYDALAFGQEAIVSNDTQNIEPRPPKGT